MEQRHSHGGGQTAGARALLGARFVALAVAPALAAQAPFAAILACNHHDEASSDCSNGTCVCPENGACGFACASPPCHVDCAPGSACSGTCANGECICELGASCSFACGAPPCHVTCEGSNPRCDGTCANGTCVCAAKSDCHFVCASGPCHTLCPAGASCTVVCPNPGVAGTQDCDIASCAPGPPTVCPDGVTLVCGTACPGDR